MKETDKKHLEYVLAGLLKPIHGEIKVKNFDYDPNNPKSVQEFNITHWSVDKKNRFAKINIVPGDRHKHGLVLDFSIRDNSILRLINDKYYAPLGFIKANKKEELFQSIVTNFDVRGTNHGNSLARSLSGGNQQKAIVGREMTTEHNLLVIVQPTRGLDVGAIDLIHKKILLEKQAGKAILLISYELDEILALADTIAVINDGRILDLKPASQFSRTEIGLLMARIKQRWRIERRRRWIVLLKKQQTLFFHSSKTSEAKSKKALMPIAQYQLEEKPITLFDRLFLVYSYLSVVLLLFFQTNPFEFFTQVVKATTNKGNIDWVYIFIIYSLASIGVGFSFKTGLFNIGVAGQMSLSGVICFALINKSNVIDATGVIKSQGLVFAIMLLSIVIGFLYALQ
nr:hypothetical protein [Mycoplasmopsis bovis]